MAFERRLREELRRDAEQIDANVEWNLGAVEARSRRRRDVPGVGLLAAAIIVALVVLVRVGGPSSDPRPGSGTSPTVGPPSTVPSPSGAPTYPQIAGTYTVDLDPSNQAVKRDGLGGSWTMRLQADGLILMSSPSTFVPGAGGLTGIAFSLEGDRFRANLFYNDHCGSVGTYAWSLRAGRLSLTPVDDTCSIRRTLLATTPWLMSP